MNQILSASIEQFSKCPRNRVDYWAVARGKEPNQANMAIEESVVPSNFNEGMSSEDSEKWLEAMQEEMKYMQDNHVFTLVEPMAHTNLVDSRWVFSIKTDPNGNLLRKLRH